MKYEIYIPGEPKNEAGLALDQMMKDEKIGTSYADMIRYRASGAASKECTDIYFVAHEDGIGYSRLWHGWGKHENAIGNFGNFKTLEECQGKGIGKEMMKLWHQDITTRENLPLGLFCTSRLHTHNYFYRPVGFRAAIRGMEAGPLYLPLGNSPETFQQFCDMYYQPSDFLISRPATVQYRHELDLLLRFALQDMGKEFRIGDNVKMEECLLYKPGQANMLFTEQGKCVGWEIDGGIQVHPQYEHLKIER